MKNLRKNNKGFTLVELVIVIAILAILMVVVAPQYIQYVDRARESTDANAIGEIAHAAEIAMIGDGVTFPNTNIMTVQIDANGNMSYDNNQLATAVAQIVAPTSYVHKSAAYRGTTVTITITNGAAVIS